jgi:hypothetical protein
MKKSFILSLIILLSAFYANSSGWTGIASSNPAPAGVTLIASDDHSSRLVFDIPGFELTEVATAEGPAYVINLKKATPLLEAGAPDVLKVTGSLLIPDMARMDVRVVHSSYTDYENILLAPSKGNLTRDIDPASIPYTFGEEYGRDAFYPGDLAGLRTPYIIRDYRGQAVIAYPFQYNPVTRTLRVYHRLELEVYKVGDDGDNPLVRDRMPEKISAEFAAFYERHFLNSFQNITDYTPVSEHGNMLIISYGAFMPAMQPLMDWRIQTGTPVEMVDVASIGGSTQIKSYIANYYNTNGLTFVLLVGDAAQVPTSYASGDSDNNYSYIVGNDHYPDLFIGRFSAENVQHVEIQVERTLTYEQDPDLDFDWFTRGIGIASNQGPGDDGEYDYQHIRNINDDLLDFTYTYCAELFDGSQGGNDAPGNPTPAMVATEVNTGSTIINYTGHGSTTSWGTSGFSNSHVNSLTNVGMWPFIWSVACVNGNFVNNTCFAEAWLRAEDNGSPTGAVATMMSTINQSWNPPMCGQDEMVDVLVETYPNNINRTFGAASMHGCMQMNDEYGSQGDEMTDTWVCFGDPSLHVRTAFPQTMTTSYMNTIFIGMNSLSVTADAEGGRACLTKDGQILATAFIQGGSAMLTFPELTEPCVLTLTITGFNFLPHIGQVNVVPGNTPFLVFEDDQVIDPSGNNNGFLDFGESVTYTVELFNLGGVDATNVEVTLSTSDPYITITDDYEFYGDIPAGQVVGIAGGFAMEVADDVPDEHPIAFTVTATDGDTTWILEYENMAFAPVLNIAEMIIDDHASGNGNGRLDPGETAIIKVKNFNSGHCPIDNSLGYLESECHYLNIVNNTYNVGTLGLLGSKWAEFTVEVDPDAPDGSAIAHFYYELTAGQFIETATFSKKIGLVYEDWETGNFNKFNWVQGGDKPFQITGVYPYEGSFSARSGSISDNQTSELIIDVEVMLPDSITFVYKVSSQANKDKLKFYINNTLKGEWSGVGSPWTRVAFAVEPGNYTFKWIYQKDAGGMSGSDCAWLDFITFPAPLTLTCYAGPDDYSCNGENFQCQGEATDWVAVEWTSSGDGAFDDPFILEPVYTPGSNDIATGNVILSLLAENAEGTVVDDELNLMVMLIPEAPETPAGPDYVNLNNVTSSEYTTEAVPYAEYYEWMVDPEEAGDISGIGTSGTINWNPAFLGTATIYVRALNHCGEGAFSEGFDVTVDNFVSVAEHGQDHSLKLWPNPGNGQFTFMVSGIRAGQYSLRVYNLTGNMMAEQSGLSLDNNSPLDINFSHLPNGLYFLSVEGQGIRIVRKLIISQL